MGGPGRVSVGRGLGLSVGQVDVALDRVRGDGVPDAAAEGVGRPPGTVQIREPGAVVGAGSVGAGGRGGSTSTPFCATGLVVRASTRGLAGYGGLFRRSSDTGQPQAT